MFRLPHLVVLLASLNAITLAARAAPSDPNPAETVPFLATLNDVERPYVISHRGCMIECPENTLAALRWAAQTGADAVEVDLRITADGHLVALHDKTVDRTTNGTGAVHRLAFEELRRLDAGNGQRVPVAEEVLAQARTLNLKLLLDVKDSRRIDPHRLVRMIQAHSMSHAVIVGARSVSMLKAIRLADDDLATLAFMARPELVDEYMDAGVDVIRFRARWLDGRSRLLGEIRAHGRQIWVTTGARRGRRLQSIIGLGVDGLITDYPGQALQPALLARTSSSGLSLKYTLTSNTGLRERPSWEPVTGPTH
jgi:glycerophosphoryl diester phosphodiesterase